MRRARLIFAGRVLVGGLLLALVLGRVEITTVAERLLEVAWLPLGTACAAHLCSLALQVRRWDCLLVSESMEIATATIWRWVLAANFLSLFGPGNLSGDAYRAFAARRWARSLSQSVGLVIVERYGGAVAACLVAAPAIPFARLPERGWMAAGVAATLAVLVLAPVGVARRVAAVAQRLARLRGPGRARLRDWTSRALLGLKRMASSPRVLVEVLALSVGLKLTSAVVLLLLARSLGLEVRWVDALVFLPLHTLISGLPLSINGLGLREANLVAYFSLVGLDAEQATSLALLHLLWVHATALPGGLAWWAPGARSEPDAPL